jgi:outer membrane protein assembly factor BamB/tetratricopeptide (TPR) repeat protein
MPLPANHPLGRFLALFGIGILLFHPFAAAQEVNNIFPIVPRELRQRLTRAQAALDEERYSDAVGEIGEVLNSTGSDDFFLGNPGSTDAQLSLKTQALSLLGSMPAKGRKMYELQFGADAKAALEAALNASDLAQLSEVGRRYFHTKAGYEATLLLGRYQLDQGRPLAAALTLKRVADVPTALAQYDPELSVLLATCWLHANQAAQAQETLIALKQRLPQAKVRLVDREVSLFTRDDGAVQWLQEIVGGSRSPLLAAATQWALYRGDEKRNAESVGGLPLLNFNWKLPTVNDPKDEERVTTQYRLLRDRDEPLICALQPLVVQDYAIIRQPESNKLVGINLTKHGKREWVYPPFDESAVTKAVNQALQASRNPAANVRENELKQRIWEDHCFGQVSSDGRQVYVIDDLSFAPIPNVNMAPFGVGRGGMRFPNPSATKSHNLLVALDLAKQGYIRWAVGGATGDNPALAGAFFLGAPLPVGDQVYALAEFSGEIRLICLDARTGGVEWKQPLANLEEQQITYDRSRRLAGASPSLADGILICPTSAGAVVAVDIATRTLRWGYQYRRNDWIPQPSRGGFRGGMAIQNTPVNPGATWLDATATIADGSVILTPPESQHLHCLDLLTGKARWSPISRDDMLVVACVHKGKIILLGRNRVRAINLSDGKPAWANDLKLDAEVVVGRGYQSEGFYYLPVSGQQICKIDLKTGTIAGRAQTEIELGNLVCYKDQLISVSPQSVASFVLLSEHLEQQLQERLAANPKDIDALALKAQILLQEGKADKSLELLRSAHKLAPDQSTIRSLLVKVMLALVRQDFAAHAALTDELDKLVTDPVQRREVLRWRIQGLASTDRHWDAFQAILELADQELAQASAGAATATLEPIDRQRNVRVDRWLAGQLQRLMDRTDSDTRSRIAAELKQRIDRAISIGGISQLRMMLSLFGSHELSDAVRLTLIDRLIAADGLSEAEFVCGDLLHSDSRAIRAAARGLLATIYERAKRPELAARMYRELASDYPDVIARGNQTGAELARRAGEIAALKPYLPAAWPMGQVDVKEDNEVTGASPSRMAYPLQMTHYFGAAPRGLKASFDSTRFEVSIRSDSGQLLTAAAPKNSDGSPRRQMYVIANNALSGQANGHLVIVNLGADIIAIDALRTDRVAESLLWRQDAVDDPANNPNAQRVFSPQVRSRNPLLGNRNVNYDSAGKLNFNTGPITGSGVAFQRGRQIVCVDPVTGQTLWERSSSTQAEIPQQADIFGDDELLLIANASLDTKQPDDVLVLSSLDGSVLGQKKIEPAERRWATHGRRVLAWEEKNSTITVRLYDAWNDQRVLWSRQVARGTRGHIIDGEELAILEPGGQFTIVSLADGSVRFAVPLEAEPSLAWIQVIRSENQYLLLASQESGPVGGGGLTPLPIISSLQQTGMHGRVYAFHRSSGKLQWQTPAFVSHHKLPPDQPTESPLLFFIGQRQTNNKTPTAILALDRRTGRNVYENELSGPTTVTCDITADPVKQTVTLGLVSSGTRNVTFHFTDKPLPPQPPAQTGEMASSARRSASSDNTLGAAIELLKRGLIPDSPPRPAPPAP